jgi:hypothetical protein
MPPLQLLEDEIGRKLREAEESGELQSAKGYGSHLTEPTGWDETPDELRMPFKILKDAGVVPAEIEMLKQRSELREKLRASTSSREAESLRLRLATLEVSISLRLEALRGAK